MPTYISCEEKKGKNRFSDLLLATNLRRLCEGTKELSDITTFSLQDILDKKNMDKYETIECDDICKYIVYSSFSHFHDAWEYAGCAIDALLKQHNPMAIHFAYYAELRAMLSMLAANGVTNKASTHLMTLTTDGTNDKLIYIKDLKTHDIWIPINNWFQSDNNAVDLFNYTDIGGKNSVSSFLKELTSTEAIGITLFSFIGQFFKCLEKANEDKKIRNDKSYRPQTLMREIDTLLPGKSYYKDAISLLKTCWSWTASANTFQNIDRSILIYILNLMLKDKRYNKKILIKKINTLLEKYNIDIVYENNEYIYNIPTNSEEIIKFSLSEDSNNPIVIITRAILLIRFSELAIRKLFIQNKLDVKLIEDYLISLIKNAPNLLEDLTSANSNSFDEMIKELKEKDPDSLEDLLLSTSDLDRINIPQAINIYEDITCCRSNALLNEDDKISYLQALLLSHSIERIGIASLYKIS